MTAAYKYLFGPVNSRRLGVSLGIDVIPFKTCSFNCVYCECGATTLLTTKREEYVPYNDVVKELEEYLAGNPELDVITFSGSGEPTLYSRLGELVLFLKKNYPQYQIAVLTNSSLLWQQDLRSELLPVDIVVPTFNAVSLDVFRKIVRPPREIEVEKIIEGLVAFGQEFGGTLILEVFIVPGINTSEDELQKIKDVCNKIHPVLVQINSLDRPGAVDWVEAPPAAELERIREFLRPLPVEIIGKTSYKAQAVAGDDEGVGRILATLRRRPSTAEDLQLVLRITPGELSAVLDSLVEAQKIIPVERDKRIFYKLAPCNEPLPEYS